jgi:hypothetical protein
MAHDALTQKSNLLLHVFICPEGLTAPSRASAGQEGSREEESGLGQSAGGGSVDKGFLTWSCLGGFGAKVRAGAVRPVSTRGLFARALMPRWFQLSLINPY